MTFLLYKMGLLIYVRNMLWQCFVYSFKAGNLIYRKENINLFRLVFLDTFCFKLIMDYFYHIMDRKQTNWFSKNDHENLENRETFHDAIS